MVENFDRQLQNPGDSDSGMRILVEISSQITLRKMILGVLTKSLPAIIMIPLSWKNNGWFGSGYREYSVRILVWNKNNFQQNC